MKWGRREVSRASDSWFLTQLRKGFKKEKSLTQTKTEGKKLLLPKATEEKHSVCTAALCRCAWWGIIFAASGLISVSQTHAPFCWNTAASEFPPIWAHLLTLLKHPNCKYQPQPSPSPPVITLPSKILFHSFSSLLYDIIKIMDTHLPLSLSLWKTPTFPHILIALSSVLFGSLIPSQMICSW